MYPRAAGALLYPYIDAESPHVSQPQQPAALLIDGRADEKGGHEPRHIERPAAKEGGQASRRPYGARAEPHPSPALLRSSAFMLQIFCDEIEKNLAELLIWDFE